LRALLVISLKIRSGIKYLKSFAPLIFYIIPYIEIFNKIYIFLLNVP
ncbi:unnamed protein product, partial [marine sediment metagenome]